MNNPTGMKVVAWCDPQTGSIVGAWNKDQYSDSLRNHVEPLVTLADAEDYARKLFAEYQKANHELNAAYTDYMRLGDADSGERWNEVGGIYAEKRAALAAALSKLGEKGNG